VRVAVIATRAERAPVGTVARASRLSRMVSLWRSPGVTGPTVSGEPRLLPSPRVPELNVTVTLAASPWLPTPPRYALRLARTWPASISAADPEMSTNCSAPLIASLGPPAKKLVPPPMLSLTDVGGNRARPYSMTVKFEDVSHPVGAACSASVAGATGCSAPGFWTRLPCGTAAPASDAHARAAVASEATTTPALRTSGAWGGRAMRGYLQMFQRCPQGWGLAAPIRSRSPDDEGERRSLRSAARLIHSELKTIEIELRAALSLGRWGTLPEIETAQWVEHEQDLSVWLSNTNWQSLADVYQSIALFVTEFAEAQLDATDDEPVVASGDDLAQMRLTLTPVTGIAWLR
jgi:hypothetical protein